MRATTRTIVSALCVLVLATAAAAAAVAQTAEVKERAPMYTYEANGVYPRASWPDVDKGCLLYTSPSPRDGLLSRMPSSA